MKRLAFVMAAGAVLVTAHAATWSDRDKAPVARPDHMKQHVEFTWLPEEILRDDRGHELTEENRQRYVEALELPQNASWRRIQNEMIQRILEDAR